MQDNIGCFQPLSNCRHESIDDQPASRPLKVAQKKESHVWSNVCTLEQHPKCGRCYEAMTKKNHQRTASHRCCGAAILHHWHEDKLPDCNTVGVTFSKVSHHRRRLHTFFSRHTPFYKTERETHDSTTLAHKVFYDRDHASNAMKQRSQEMYLVLARRKRFCTLD